MATQQYVNVLEAAVAIVPVADGRQYDIIPTLNVKDPRMGLIALGADFPYGGPVYERLFTEADNGKKIRWPIRGVEGDFSQLIFYMLLPITEIPSADVVTRRYYIGIDDGEVPDNIHPAAMLDLRWSAQQPDPPKMDPPNAPFLSLPANAIALVPGRHLPIYPEGDNPWVSFIVPEQNHKRLIEANSCLHVLAGRSGSIIDGVITKYQNLAARLNLAGTHANLVAFVAPSLLLGDPDDWFFNFNVGDPEKDGVIRVTRV